MDKLKRIVILIFCVGCVGYGIVNLLFIFKNDFVYRYASMFEKIRNFSFVVLMVGLLLLVIFKIIERKI